MGHLDIPQFVGLLVVMLGTAKFAQTGLASGVFTPPLFSAVTMMVLVTTFIAPPLLKALLPPGPQTPPPPAAEGIEELVTEPEQSVRAP